MFDLKEELKHLPEQPGVYIMHNKDDKIIYIGKAKILKNRVRQYFQSSNKHTPKVKAMVENIAYFEYIVTDSEIEALVLECNLIKKHRPKYNILLKDDKHYPYIKVTINKEYPKMFMTRKLENDGAKYFGPYMGSNTIKKTFEIIQKLFAPPTCRRNFPNDIGKGRPCLNYHIKNCFAPCTGNVSKEEYRRIYFDICSFLEGNHTKLLSELTQQMKVFSEKLDFEKAADLRDKINAIKAVSEKQKIINASKQIDEDIIAFAKLDDKAFVEVFFVRLGKIIGRENYTVDNVSGMQDCEIMSDFMKQFYAETAYIPVEILVEYEMEDFEVIKEWLSEKRGRKIDIQVPKRGEKKRLVEMVKKNAVIALENNKIKVMKETEKNEILKNVKECLNLDKEPMRIESFDISNISGTNNVASMVVFENGKPKKSAYRIFKIKSFEGADDYAAMQEIIYRRFRRAHDEIEQIENGSLKAEDAKFLPMPDVLFIDGGKGHIGAVDEILQQIDIDIPVFGMVKDDKHRTRGMVSKDGEIGISLTSSIFHFVTRIQDEVHRVAISYHRKLRSKDIIKSELDNIAGVGEKRKSALLTHFKSIENIKNADIEEIKSVDGIDSRTAQNINDYFKKGESNV